MQAWLETLTAHVTGTWGRQGEAWLENLPEIVSQLQQKWSLKDIKPICFPSYNYVAFCNHKNNIPVVLKISCDVNLIADEYKTHQHFNGQGAVSILEYDNQLHAVLLERAVPGDALKLIDRDDAIATYANIIKQLHSCEQNNLCSYEASDDWLKTIDNITDLRLEKYIILAKDFILKLKANPAIKKICHADLHLGNIILNEEKYLAIDPKGVVGEMAFEASAFDLLTKQEIQHNSDLKDIIQKRIKKLSDVLQCEYQRLFIWFYLRSLISAQWFVEDQGDLSERLLLLKYLSDLSR